MGNRVALTMIHFILAGATAKKNNKKKQKEILLAGRL